MGCSRPRPGKGRPGARWTSASPSLLHVPSVSHLPAPSLSPLPDSGREERSPWAPAVRPGYRRHRLSWVGKWSRPSACSQVHPHSRGITDDSVPAPRPGSRGGGGGRGAQLPGRAGVLTSPSAADTGPRREGHRDAVPPPHSARTQGREPLDCPASWSLSLASEVVRKLLSVLQTEGGGAAEPCPPGPALPATSCSTLGRPGAGGGAWVAGRPPPGCGLSAHAPSVSLKAGGS